MNRTTWLFITLISAANVSTHVSAANVSTHVSAANVSTHAQEKMYRQFPRWYGNGDYVELISTLDDKNYYASSSRTWEVESDAGEVLLEIRRPINVTNNHRKIQGSNLGFLARGAYADIGDDSNQVMEWAYETFLYSLIPDSFVTNGPLQYKYLKESYEPWCAVGYELKSSPLEAKVKTLRDKGKTIKANLKGVAVLERASQLYSSALRLTVEDVDSSGESFELYVDCFAPHIIGELNSKNKMIKKINEITKDFFVIKPTSP